MMTIYLSRTNEGAFILVYVLLIHLISKQDQVFSEAEVEYLSQIGFTKALPSGVPRIYDHHGSYLTKIRHIRYELSVRFQPEDEHTQICECVEYQNLAYQCLVSYECKIDYDNSVSKFKNRKLLFLVSCFMKKLLGSYNNAHTRSK